MAARADSALGRATQQLCALGVLACLWAGAASAGFEVCNDTDQVQSIAIGYKGESDWTSEGWWNIRPGRCATLVPGNLTKRYYYYHARNARGTFEGQDYVFCTAPRAFTIVGDTDCAARGFESSDFREVDTGETDVHYTLRMVDRGPSGGPKSPEGDAAPELAPGPLGEGRGLDGGEGTQNVELAPSDTDLALSVGTLESDLSPGSHGAPFAEPVLFQGCELEDGLAYCGFHGTTGKMRAFYGGPTPETIFFALEDMAPNTPLILEADRAERRGQISAVVIRKVAPNLGGDPHSGLRARLQGDWVSEADARAEIELIGSEMVLRRRGKFQALKFVRVDARCTGLDGPGPVLIQTDPDGGNEGCFRILRADAARLELMPVPRDKPLRYRRP